MQGQQLTRRELAGVDRLVDVHHVLALGVHLDQHLALAHDLICACEKCKPCEEGAEKRCTRAQAERRRPGCGWGWFQTACMRARMRSHLLDDRPRAAGQQPRVPLPPDERPAAAVAGGQQEAQRVQRGASPRAAARAAQNAP